MDGIIKDNAQLTTAAAGIGIRHGYDSIKAEFAPFRDFKVKWTRSYRWIEFEVSDYLRDAPESAITALFETVFDRIKGDEGKGFPEALTGYITSEEFLTTRQPVYLRRLRSSGQADWLDDSVEELRDMGFEVPEHTTFVTVNTGSSRSLGRTSALMRTVAMSTRCEELSPRARNYAVLKELAMVCAGWGGDRQAKAGMMEDILRQFPERGEAEREIMDSMVL